jgi:serine/threonine protein kinase
MSSPYIGKVLDNYRIIESLGIGGMGIVFKAIHIKLEKIFALKMITPGLVMNENFLKRFQAEAKSLAKFEDPNIVRVYDLRSDDDRWFIVMEFVDGINLLEKIKRDGPFPWQEALPILEQMLSGISHAHASGIIHRDIKPNNIMITKDGTVKITDFGLAKDQTSGSSTLTVASGGTLYYMSPEHVKGFSFTDKRSDVYSVGMTFYEMLTGSVPFKDINSDFDIREKIVRKEFEKPTTINPDIPDELESIIVKAIAKDPEERFQTAEEMLQAILDFEATVSKDIRNFSQPVRKSENGSPKLKDSINILKAKILGGDKINFKNVPWFRITSLALGLLVIIIFVSLVVKRNGKSPVESKAEILPAHLSITSTPSLATVILDNDSIGLSPLKSYTLTPGQHSLRLTRNDYLPVDTTISPVSGNQLDLTFQLISKITDSESITEQVAEKNESTPNLEPTAVYIQSEPPGAEIWMNNKYRGSTPKKVTNLQPGDYRIKISKEGFEDTIKSITLNGKSSPELMIPLIASTGNLQIVTVPESANIILDGKKIPQLTPANLKEIPIGEHQIEITKKGYASINRKLVVKKAETFDLKIELVKQMGSLGIQVRPWGSIYLDDKLQKSSSNIKYNLELPVDRYKLKVIHPTLGVWEKSIEIKPGETTEITVDFNYTLKIPVTAIDDFGNPIVGEIYLDDHNTGKTTPAEIVVNVGLHKFSVKKDGYTADNEKTEILVDRGLDNPQKFLLKKADTEIRLNQ